MRAEKNGRVRHYSPGKQTVNGGSIRNSAVFVKLALLPLLQVAVFVVGLVFWRLAQVRAMLVTSLANEQSACSK